MTMDERELERLARQLGARRARRVDPARVAATVAARLRAGEQLPRRGTARLARWGLAAAAVLTVLVVSDGLRTGGEDGSTGSAVPVALTDLDNDGLGEALDSLVYTAPASEFVGWGPGTMTADELEALLAAMEG